MILTSPMIKDRCPTETYALFEVCWLRVPPMSRSEYITIVKLSYYLGNFDLAYLVRNISHRQGRIYSSRFFFVGISCVMYMYVAIRKKQLYMHSPHGIYLCNERGSGEAGKRRNFIILCYVISYKVHIYIYSLFSRYKQ